MTETIDSHGPARSPNSSITELGELVMPHLANSLGNLHGGELLSRIDKCGAVAAMRHAGTPCVTASVDRVDFHEPIMVGEVIRLVARVNYVGRSSMEVGVEVYAENPVTRVVRHTNSCFLTMVGIGPDCKPVPVPALKLESEEDHARFEEGKERALARKKRRKSQT